MVATTCMLYGATTYSNSWIGINVLVILVSFMLIAVVFAISSLLPVITREKMVSAARSEISQAMISAVILAILVGVAFSACNISASLSQAFIPKTFSAMNPFQYADYYVGNLSLNTGLNLLTTIYSTSVSYAIEGQVLQSIGAFFNTQTSSILGIIKNVIGKSTTLGAGAIGVGIAPLSNLSTLFSTLSGIYLGLSALVTLAIGLLFIQFLIIPILQYTAFAVLLPVALAMRSLAFLGSNLRIASNAVLAFAIAAYIIFPLTVTFNGYAIAWIFSASNPSYQYLHSTYLVPGITASNFFSIGPTYSGQPGALTPSIQSSLGTPLSQTISFVSSAFAKTGIVINPWTVVSQGRALITTTAQFLFASIILMVIDLAITIGFAAGLAHALNTGLEGAGSFWSV